MALIEFGTDVAPRAGSDSKGVSSPAPRGGSRSGGKAVSGALARALSRFHRHVWAKVVVRTLGILGGMLALAAIGASSIARGSGVPFSAASGAATGSFLAGGLAPIGETSTPPASARPPASAAPAASSGGRGREEPPASDAGTAPSSGLTADGKVILNLAGPDQLRKLPGIGEKRAQAIVALRTKLGGRFKRLTDLLRVKGIGPKGLKKMEPHLVLDAPAG